MTLASYLHKVSKLLILVKPEDNFLHRHAMKSRRMSGGLSPFILDFGTRGDWQASRPGRFIPGASSADNHWMRSRLYPRDGLNVSEKIEVPILYVHVTVYRDMWPCCIVTNFFVMKPTRCTTFTNLFCHETIQVSDSFSAHHQEFIHYTLSNDVCHIGM